MNRYSFCRIISLVVVLLLPAGCAVTTPSDIAGNQTLYRHSPEGDTLLERFAPVFLVEESDRNYNRIGTPAFRKKSADDFKAYIDTSHSTYYALKQEFTIGEKKYANLIYRIHFPETPFPGLTSGKNVGLLVYITINDREEPLLVSTLHTCGCYLAIIPTDKFDPAGVPGWWSFDRVDVYGESLPGLLKTGDDKNPGEKLILTIRSKNHRVKDLRFASSEDPATQTEASSLKPMDDLTRLPAGSGTLSFFETEGVRKGYVRESHKPLEMAFMSWWAIDPFIGVDKALGPEEVTGRVFYTSLKFWARRKSNIWNFPTFLEYWGWDLM
ncbi:MAG: hypothetical protein KKG47_14475 [Proteobacteria bacterium]|nr:hypothetical protein [Pseudomonadota bacterium]MBU1739245.1 hypothetical protein [Pseudomonadota bacterium]